MKAWWKIVLLLKSFHFIPVPTYFPSKNLTVYNSRNIRVLGIARCINIDNAEQVFGIPYVSRGYAFVTPKSKTRKQIHHYRLVHS